MPGSGGLMLSNGDADAEILAQALEDAREREHDLLSAVAEAQAAAAEAEDRRSLAEQLAAVGREFLMCTKQLRQIEVEIRRTGACGSSFNERIQKQAELSSLYERGMKLVDDQTAIAAVYVHVEDVARFLEESYEARHALRAHDEEKVLTVLAGFLRRGAFRRGSV